MSLRDRLTEAMKTAMRAKDDITLATVRQVRSVVKNREIELKSELDDQGIGEVIASLVKQRRESIRMFAEAGRNDLAEKEERELQILLGFLPEQLTREEIAALVDRIVVESGAQGTKDMGRVMKLVMPHVAGRADGKLVNEAVRDRLSAA
ncbi:GatB/YqeY domain-containing protein [Geobacter argillaceus]|uniref:GatB/YqeY domain-containing protein n=1 Tax=Geobacter argillaceus TaxID=345631 RepID=A0A562WRY7_9BACT|nr:GatB/YqeY domain-containing protein [Geobacter argillaceus]TWJ33335.1 hypothetical protein JN12_00007 [Geobacter argillaceus]